MKAPALTLTKEENNFYKYYTLLMQDGTDIPSVASCAPYGDLHDIAVEMSGKRAQSIPALKSYIASLSRLKERKYKRLVVILSSATGQAESTIINAPAEVAPVIEFLPSHVCPPLPDGVAIDDAYSQGVTPLKDAYVAYSQLKSPRGYEDFHPTCYWSMLSDIAARRIAIDLASKQYTPLQAQLAARSTLYAKTTTAEVKREVLQRAGLGWLLGATRTTPQNLLREMSGVIPESAENMNDDALHILAMSGQRGWIYHEFGKLVKAMIRSNGPTSDFVEVLLQISDSPSALEVGTISRGTETILKPYLSILGTLTPASIKSVAGRSAELWSDGFLSRMIWSCPPPDSYKTIPFQRGEVNMPSELITGLHNWHMRLGLPELQVRQILNEEGKPTGRYEKVWIKPLPERVYTMSDDAYEAWAKYSSALISLIIKFNTTDFDGSYGRLSDAALRVAALCASIESNSNTIEFEHWTVAQAQAEKWRESLHRLYAQVNSSAEPESGPTLDDRVIEQVERLQAKQPPTAREVARSLHMETNKIEPILISLVRDNILYQIPSAQTFRYAIVEAEE